MTKEMEKITREKNVLAGYLLWLGDLEVGVQRQPGGPPGPERRGLVLAHHGAQHRAAVALAQVRRQGGRTVPEKGQLGRGEGQGNELGRKEEENAEGDPTGAAPASSGWARISAR